MTRITLTGGAVISGAALLTGGLLITACSAGGSTASAPLSAAQHALSGNGGYRAAGPAAPQALAGPGIPQKTVQTARLAPANQSIIYTASLTLRSASATATAQQAISIVAAAGGYTASEQAVAGSPGHPGGTVSLTVKVPVPNYQTVLTALSAPKLGKQLALRQQTTDVTQEVANVASLVTSQQDAITALQRLLGRAGSVSQLLQVQQQISSDESYLESLLAQQRALDHETSYATISMTLLSTQHPVVHKHHIVSHNFLTGLTAGWRALRHAAAVTATALGAALPFLIIVALLAAAGYAARRRVSRRRTGPTAAS